MLFASGDDAKRHSDFAQSTTARIVRLPPGGSVRGDCRAGFVCGARSGGESDVRTRRSAPVLARRRGHGHGHRDLVDALRGHAGVPLASSGGIRLADGPALAAGGDLCLGSGALRGQPQKDGPAGSHHRKHFHGRRDRRDALHRDGGDAAAGDVRILAGPGSAFDCGSDGDFAGRAVADLSLSRGKTLGRLAQSTQRSGDGRGDSGDALHRDGRGAVSGLQSRSKGAWRTP